MTAPERLAALDAALAVLACPVCLRPLERDGGALRCGAGHELEPLFPDAFTRRGQDLPPLVAVSGAVWWARAAVLRREGTFHVAGRTGWEMPWTGGLDIDTEDDWELAEWVAMRREAAHAGCAG